MSDKVFKIKHNGQKLKARILKKNEKITEKSLQIHTGSGVVDHLSDEELQDLIARASWKPSGSVGEMPSEHPERVYIEVMSPFYNGESVLSKSL